MKPAAPVTRIEPPGLVPPRSGLIAIKRIPSSVRGKSRLVVWIIVQPVVPAQTLYAGASKPAVVGQPMLEQLQIPAA